MSEGNKFTPLCEVPEDWELVPLYELRNKADRYSFTGGPFGSDLKSEHYTSSGVRIIQLQDIGEGQFLDKSQVYTTKEKADQLISCNIYPGEIILAKMAPVARCCKVPDTAERFVMCSDGIRLAVDPRKYSNEFVYQALNSEYFRKEAEAQSTGTTRARIGLNDLKQIPIIVPVNFAEQQKIAEILTTVDEKINVIDAQISQTQELKKGLMQQLLTRGIGHTQFKISPLGEIPECWRVVELGTFADIKRGLASQHLFYVDDPMDGVRLIRINDFKSNDPKYIRETNETKKLTLKKGDVLMAGTGATAGISFLVREKWSGLPFSYNAPRIRVKEGLESTFLYYFLNTELISDQQKKLFTGNAQPFLDTRAIANLKINLPPTEEQRVLIEILSTVDEKIEVLQEKKNNYHELKKGLMQQLLTGKIRVNQSNQNNDTAKQGNLQPAFEL
jgi:type I restriction enzyme S subunit